MWGSAKLQAGLRRESHAFNMDYIKCLPQHVFFSRLSSVAMNFRVWSDETAFILYIVLRPISLSRDYFFVASSIVPQRNSQVCRIGQLTCNHCAKSEFYLKYTGIYFLENLEIYFFYNRSYAKLVEKQLPSKLKKTTQNFYRGENKKPE